MIKKFFTVLVIIVIFFGFYKLTSQKPASIINTSDSDLVLFYGNTCPHCKDVEEFISKNKIDQKLKISQLEVYDNKPNSILFANIVKEICPDKSTPEGIPVPFLVNQKDKQCFIGTPDITGYLTKKSK